MVETTIRKPIPLGIYLIAAFYLFGAVVLVLGTLTGLVDARMATVKAHGLPAIAGNMLVLLVALLALVLGYGLISLSRWGYFLTIAYSLYLVLVSLALSALIFPLRGDEEVGLYFGNLLWSILVVVYLFLVRQRFQLTK